MAEKPSISKAVAGHLSGGQYQTVSQQPPPFLATSGSLIWKETLTAGFFYSKHNTRNQYIKNYSFDFDFAQAWGQCSVTMTCVTGHLTNVEFTSEYKNWSFPPPETLFNAPIVTNVHDVSLLSRLESCKLLIITGQEEYCQEHRGSSQVCSDARDMDRL